MKRTHSKMKIIGVIPARYKSSRFPGKPLADIFGKPMIYWVYKRVEKARLLDDFLIATDDRQIFAVCKNYGLKVTMTSNKHINGTERVAEVANIIDGDIFINIQGDEPLISPITIDRVVMAFKKDHSLEYAQAAKAIINPEDFINNTVVKIAVTAENWALYLSRSPIPYPRSFDKFKAFKHIGVYGYKKKFLLDLVKMKESQLESVEGIEQLRALENGKKLKIIEVENDTVSVDTKNDLNRIISNYRSFFK